MTWDELKAMHAKMTQKPLKVAEWGAVEGGPAESYHLYHDEKHGAHVASWLSPDNARGIVALHNAFPAIVAQFEAMRAALEAANLLLHLSDHKGCSGHRQVEAALALADKPLTEDADAKRNE